MLRGRDWMTGAHATVSVVLPPALAALAVPPALAALVLPALLHAATASAAAARTGAILTNGFKGCLPTATLTGIAADRLDGAGSAAGQGFSKSISCHYYFVNPPGDTLESGPSLTRLAIGPHHRTG